MSTYYVTEADRRRQGALELIHMGNVATRGGAGTTARVGEEARLAWAVRFAQVDLSTWRDGDWLNALDDAKKLALAGAAPPLYAGLTLFWSLKGNPLTVAKAVLRPLQKPLREFLDRVDRQRQAKPIELPFKGRCVFVATGPGQRLRAYYV